MIRVVLADDHAYVRMGIRNILNNTPDITVIGEAADGTQALRLVDQLHPDVLVLDVEMPGLKGYEVARFLHHSHASLPVLAVSAHEDRQYILGMLSQGAYGYLTKDEVPDTLVKALRGVARGEKGWVSRRIAARIALWIYREKPGKLQVSDQEIRLLTMVLEGKSLHQIAEECGLDVGHTEHLLTNLFSQVRKNLPQLL